MKSQQFSNNRFFRSSCFLSIVCFLFFSNHVYAGAGSSQIKKEEQRRETDIRMKNNYIRINKRRYLENIFYPNEYSHKKIKKETVEFIENQEEYKKLDLYEKKEVKKLLIEKQISQHELASQLAFSLDGIRHPGSWDLGSQTMCRRPVPVQHQIQKFGVATFDGQAFIEHGLQGQHEKIVNSQDGRKRVANSEVWPYTIHGFLAIRMDGQNYVGSGTLFAPGFVLTAAHNVYDCKKKQDATELVFYSRVNGDLFLDKQYKVSRWFCPEDYKNGQESEDYAILALEGEVEDAGHAGLHLFDPNDDMKNTTIHVTGYPGDKATSQKHEMWTMANKPWDVKKDTGQIHYKIDTYGGQSGSGLWYEDSEGDVFLVGVHVLGGAAYNTGTLLTYKRYSQIKTWVEDCAPVINFEYTGESGGFYNALGAMLFQDPPYEDVKLDYENLNWIREQEWPQLKNLEIRNSYRIDRIFEPLAKGHWPKIRSIKLIANKVRDDEIRNFTQGKNPFLEEVDLHWNEIRDDGAKAITSGFWPEQLRTLDLSANRIGDAGIKHLSQKKWDKLETLRLSNSWAEGRIGDDGAIALSQGCWPKLCTLDLSLNQMSDKGAEILVKSKPSFPHLKNLSLEGNKILNKQAIQTLFEENFENASISL